MPSGVVYVVASGMNGVWFAGLMNPQPIAMTSSTMLTLSTTMMPLTIADSCVPRMSSAVSASKMTSAGMLTMPLTPFSDSNGPCDHWNGTRMPNQSSTRFAYSAHAIPTVAAPTASSSTGPQRMIHATSSPIVAYEYV